MKKAIIYGCLSGALALLAGCGGGTYGGSSSKSTDSAPAGTASAASSAYGASAAGAVSGGQSLTVTTKHTKDGIVLAAGPKKLTVYLFEADRGNRSACSGTCAEVWPPVTGTAGVSGQARAADLGTTTRSDGTKQLTYGGHPLYYFAKDKDDGDAYGQGIKSFGADWYVLKPSGSKLDTDGGDGGAS